MSSGIPYIGTRISLISKADIRYEGRLYSIDAKESTVSLQNVRSFGTEGRGEKHIPPSLEIYEFIVFRGSDIKDLTVCEPPPQQQAQIQPPNDPAIINSGSFPTHPPNPNSSSMYPPYPYSHSGQPGMNPYGGGSYWGSSYPYNPSMAPYGVPAGYPPHDPSHYPQMPQQQQQQSQQQQPQQQQPQQQQPQQQRQQSQQHPPQQQPNLAQRTQQGQQMQPQQQPQPRVEKGKGEEKAESHQRPTEKQAQPQQRPAPTPKNPEPQQQSNLPATTPYHPSGEKGKKEEKKEETKPVPQKKQNPVPVKQEKKEEKAEEKNNAHQPIKYSQVVKSGSAARSSSRPQSRYNDRRGGRGGSQRDGYGSRRNDWRSGRNSGNAGRSGARAIPESDFDFEKNLDKFDKEKLKEQIEQGEKEEDDKEIQNTYNKDDFFDSISCETQEKLARKQHRPDRRELHEHRRMEAARDMETFGAASVDHHRGNRRYGGGGYRSRRQYNNSGRGRRYGGNHHGNYHHNQNQKNYGFRPKKKNTSEEREL